MAQDMSNFLIPDDSIFYRRYFITQSFSIHGFDDDDYGYELFTQTRLFYKPSRLWAFGLNVKYIHTYCNEYPSQGFLHLGPIAMLSLLQKEYKHLYLEGGSTYGNYYWMVDEYSGQSYAIKRGAVNLNFGIGYSLRLNSRLFVDFGAGFMSIFYKRLPDTHNASGFYRIGIGYAFSSIKKSRASTVINTRDL
jgi:hypothetical protein